MALQNQLKDRLRDAQASGKVVLGSGAQVAEDKPSGLPTTGDVTTTVPVVANEDPLLNNAEGSIGKKLSSDAVGAAGDSVAGNMAESPDDLFTTEAVTLTEEERNAFLDALINGNRYERKFSLYDGRVKGRFRCRSTEESEAIAAWMNIGVREGRFKSALDFGIAMRNALLAAGVMDLNGTRLPELPGPMFRTQNGDKITDPGWLAAAEAWSKRPEPIVSAVYEELRVFERKYWTMVTHARDQNFWHPAEST